MFYMNNKKAPGPEAILGKVYKLAFQSLMNVPRFLSLERDEACIDQPLIVLDSAGKVFKKLFRIPQRPSMYGVGVLPSGQFGFRTQTRWMLSRSPWMRLIGRLERLLC